MSRTEAPRLRPNRAASILYNGLVRSQWLGRYPYVSRLWQSAWRHSCRLLSVPVRTTIHGRKVIVNYGHTYPLTSRRYRTFNNPLVELVFQTYSVKKRPITLVDVGANIGDTILLVESNCPGMIEEFVCVDADPEFFAYLQNNLGGLHYGKLLLALLSSTNCMERTLVRTHAGTASAQGVEKTSSITLDSVLVDAGVRHVDVLKTDVDGLDGRVLLGAEEILQKYRPAVVFEWHPLLCRRTSRNWTDHFDALERSGYTRFIWFTKYGDFSHYTALGERTSIGMLAELCLRDQAFFDWHYDVVALTQDIEISHLSLAELAYAKARKSSH